MLWKKHRLITRKPKFRKIAKRESYLRIFISIWDFFLNLSPGLDLQVVQNNTDTDRFLTWTTVWRYEMFFIYIPRIIPVFNSFTRSLSFSFLQSLSWKWTKGSLLQLFYLSFSLTAKQALCHVSFDLFRLIKKEREWWRWRHNTKPTHQ